MISIDKIEELKKFKTEDFINKNNKRIIHYEFNDNVTFNIASNLMKDVNSLVILKGKNFEFKHKVLAYCIEATGNVTCINDKHCIQSSIIKTSGDVSVGHLECDYLECHNLYGNKIFINDNLYCLGEINCDDLCVKHISSFRKLSAKTMIMRGSLFLNVSAEGESIKPNSKIIT